MTRVGVCLGKKASSFIVHWLGLPNSAKPSCDFPNLGLACVKECRLGLENREEITLPLKGKFQKRWVSLSVRRRRNSKWPHLEFIWHTVEQRKTLDRLHRQKAFWVFGLHLFFWPGLAWNAVWLANHVHSITSWANSNNCDLCYIFCLSFLKISSSGSQGWPFAKVS